MGERSSLPLLLVLWAINLAFMLSTGHALFRFFFYLFTALIAFSALWVWQNFWGLEVQRALISPRAQVGKVLEEELVVRNRSPLPKLWLEVRDHSNLPAHVAGKVIGSIPPKGEYRWSVKTLCRKRGQFTLGPITVVSSDPLGLIRLEKTFPAQQEVTVYPPIYPLPYFKLRAGILPGGEVVRQRAPFATINVAGVREYNPGDSFSRIHWPTTAHVGRLMVKEFELDPLSNIWLFLDLDRGVQKGQGWPRSFVESRGPSLFWAEGWSLRPEPTTEEYSVAIAASLASHFLKEKRALGIAVYSRTKHVLRPERGTRQLLKVLEFLAVVGAESDNPFEELLASESHSLEGNSTIIAITPSESIGWVKALRGFKLRGISALAIIIADELSAYQEVLAELKASAIPWIFVRLGDEVPTAMRFSEV